jgi:hypothetical protein
MWTVKLHAKTIKALALLPVSVCKALEQLAFDLQAHGPVAGNWPNYGKLDGERHHCHLKKGRPTYVAVWRAVSEIQKNGEAKHIIEVIYVGTHEKAPY